MTLHVDTLMTVAFSRHGHARSHKTVYSTRLPSRHIIKKMIKTRHETVRPGLNVHKPWTTLDSSMAFYDHYYFRLGKSLTFGKILT